MALYGSQGIVGAWDPLKPNWTWGHGKDVARIRDVNKNIDKLVRDLSKSSGTNYMMGGRSQRMKGGGTFTPMAARQTINVLDWKDGSVSVQNTNEEFMRVIKRLEDFDKHMNMALKEGARKAFLDTKKYVQTHRNKGGGGVADKYRGAKRKTASLMRLHVTSMSGDTQQARFYVGGGYGGLKGKGKAKGYGKFSLSRALDVGTFGSTDAIDNIPWQNYFSGSGKGKRTIKAGSPGGIGLPAGRGGFNTKTKVGGRLGHFLPFGKEGSKGYQHQKRGGLTRGGFGRGGRAMISWGVKGGGRRMHTIQSGRFNYLGSTLHSRGYGGMGSFSDSKMRAMGTKGRGSFGPRDDKDKHKDWKVGYQGGQARQSEIDRMYKRSTDIDHNYYKGSSGKGGHFPLPALNYMERYGYIAELETTASLWKRVNAVLHGKFLTMQQAISNSNRAWDAIKRDLGADIRPPKGYKAQSGYKV